MVLHYDLDAVSAILLGVPVQDYAVGDSIEIELAEDDWVTTQGHHGSIVRAKRPNEIAEATITLMQGSPINELLMTAADLDRRTGLGAGVTQVKDTNGTTVVASARSYIKKRPNVGLGTEPGSVEWVVVLTNPDFWVGSNRLV